MAHKFLIPYWLVEMTVVVISTHDKLNRSVMLSASKHGGQAFARKSSTG
ncbi:hypothetical protein MTO98_02740 [Mucilaginibacter sp. SMC90]|nr:hypothetical protein [Mucilaginibacter sp. SMC90]UOE49987.1 hypothetical protein MTO98_02740 [Mucilaginibacter sp. SMC90]